MSRCIRFVALLLLVLVSLSASTAFAGAVSTLDQSDVSLSNAYNVAGFVSAADFVVTGSTILVTGATIWLTDGDSNNDGVLNNFSGNLSWAVYADDGGQPGTLFQSGKALAVVQTDTGLQAVFGDVIQVHFDLDRPLPLGAGVYWLAIHENSWGSGFDGSSLFWEVAAHASAASLVQSENLNPPGPWNTVAGDDLAFALYGGPLIWNQNSISSLDAFNLSYYVAASDFTLGTAQSFSTIELWIWTALDADFSGTMSWKIYTDNAGKPGTEIAGGVDASTRVVPTGFNYFGYDVRQVRVSLRRSVTLAAGSYWLALHEGAWGSAGDGTSFYWDQTTSNFGYQTLLDDNPAAPASWNAVAGPDVAFVLFNEELFGSDFEPATSCAWSNVGGVCP
jgi:hypothetical protein